MTNATDTGYHDAATVNSKRLGTALLAAVALNLLVFAAGSALGATWEVNGQTVSWIMVVAATAIALVIGGLITFALSRRWSKATAVMSWVGLAFAVASAPAPLVSTDGAISGWMLATMHVLTGLAWFIAIRPIRTLLAN